MNLAEEKISDFLKNKNFMMDLYLEKNKFIFDIIDDLHKDFSTLSNNQERSTYYSNHVEKYNTIKNLSIKFEGNGIGIPILYCSNEINGDYIKIKFSYFMSIISLDVEIKNHQAKAELHFFFDNKKSNYYDNFKTKTGRFYQVTQSTVELYCDNRLMDVEFNQLQIIRDENKEEYPFLKNGYSNIRILNLQLPENESKNKIYIQNLFFDKTEDQERFDLVEMSKILTDNKNEFKKLIRNENNQFVKNFQNSIELSTLLNDKSLNKDSEIFLSHIDLFKGILSDEKLVLAQNKKKFSLKNLLK